MTDTILVVARQRLSEQTNRHAAFNAQLEQCRRIKSGSGEYNLAELNAKLEAWRMRMIDLYTSPENEIT